MSVRAISFEAFDIEISFLVLWSMLIISGSLGQGPGHTVENVNFAI